MQGARCLPVQCTISSDVQVSHLFGWTYLLTTEANQARNLTMQPTNQQTNQQANRQTDRPTNHPTNHPTNPNQPTITNQPTNQPKAITSTRNLVQKLTKSQPEVSTPQNQARGAPRTATQTKPELHQNQDVQPKPSLRCTKTQSRGVPQRHAPKPGIKQPEVNSKPYAPCAGWCSKTLEKKKVVCLT